MFLELTDIYGDFISINVSEISSYKQHDTDEAEIYMKNKDEAILVKHSYEDVRGRMVAIMPFLENLVERTGVVSINITEISSVKRGTTKVTIIFMHNGSKLEVYHSYDDIMAWIKNYYKK